MFAKLRSLLKSAPSSALIKLPVYAGGTLICAYGLYFGLIKSASPGGPESWGQFGDFIGGLLNPIVGTITIILLVRTLGSQLTAVHTQRRELALQRNELRLQREESARSTEALAAQNQAIKMQSFEQAFFAWLESYRQFVNSLKAGSVQGYAVLGHIVAQYSSGPLSGVADSFQTWAELHRTGEKSSSSLAKRYANVLQNYEILYQTNHAGLGPILRSLYRLIDWVDKSPIDASEKWHYVAIARSQLTWPEMMILAINGATSRGEKFVPLIERYALLDNLEGSTDYIVEAMRGPFLVNPPENFPYSSCAFSSTAAKAAHGLAAPPQEGLPQSASD